MGSGDLDALVDGSVDDGAAVARRGDERPAGVLGPDEGCERLLPERAAVVGAEVGADGEVRRDGQVHGLRAVEDEARARHDVAVVEAPRRVARRAHDDELRGGGHSDELRASAVSRGDARDVRTVAVFVDRCRVGLRDQCVNVRAGEDSTLNEVAVVVFDPPLILEIGVDAGGFHREVEHPRDARLLSIRIAEVRQDGVNARVDDADERAASVSPSKVLREPGPRDDLSVREEGMERRHDLDVGIRVRAPESEELPGDPVSLPMPGATSSIPRSLPWSPLGIVTSAPMLPEPGASTCPARGPKTRKSPSPSGACARAGATTPMHKTTRPQRIRSKRK